MPRKWVVLVIDDDAAIRASLKFSLEIEGYAVRCYSNSNEFLNQGDWLGVGCIVIDDGVPGSSGIEILRLLRLRGIRLPAILITSNVSTMLELHAADVGARIVEKPLLGDSLLEAIRSAIAEHSLKSGPSNGRQSNDAN